MTDLLIRRCTVRVVRRGGWSWGAAPRALLEGLLRRLPALLAAELEPVFPDGADVEIAAPVRLLVKLPMAALSVSGRVGAGIEAMELAASAPLRAALRQAVRAALGPVADAGAPVSDLGKSAAVDRPAPKPAVTPLGVLARWLQAGQLAERLGRLGGAALWMWHDRVFLHPAAGRDGAEVPIAAIERLVAQARGAVARGAPEGAPDMLHARLRLTVAAALAAAGGDDGLSAGTLAAILQCLPDLDAQPNRLVSSQVVYAPESLATGRAFVEDRTESNETGVVTQPVDRRLTRRAAGEIRIASVLPWLLLGPLVRVGWLATAGAALDLAGASELSPLLGVALARKVLVPPARGWRHGEAFARTAACAGLLDDPPDDADLHRLARVLEGQFGILDADIAGSLIAGHRAGTPLLLSRVGDALLLSDLDGLFPIAVAPEIGGLMETLRWLLVDPVLVDAEAASADGLAALDRASVRFVTSAPPGRGESWRRVADGVWSNDGFTAPARLAGMLRNHAAGAEMAVSAWQAIVLDRPAIPRAGLDSFEASLGLAASLALGDIAWTLWGGAEPVSPELALDRFADLDGVVRMEDATVTVRLPLGRRFFDLREHGFLDDVPDVPWFGGRVLRFDTG